MSGHLSSHDIAALELGALSGEPRKRAEAHAAACDRCRRNVEHERALAGHFARDVLPRTLAALSRRGPGTQRLGFPRWPRAWAWAWAGGAAAAAACVALALAMPARLGHRQRGAGADGPEIALKGGRASASATPGLRMFARRDGRVFAVSDGARLRSGDEVRFVAEAGGYPYLLLASIDGAFKVNIYFPFDGERSGAVRPGAANELPDSVRLDESPGPERLFALFSRAPLAAADVRASLGTLAARGTAGIRAERAAPVATDASATLLFEKEAP